MKLIPCPCCSNPCSPMAIQCPECGEPIAANLPMTNRKSRLGFPNFWKYSDLVFFATIILTLSLVVYFSISNRSTDTISSPPPSLSQAPIQKQAPAPPTPAPTSQCCYDLKSFATPETSDNNQTVSNPSDGGLIQSDSPVNDEPEDSYVMVIAENANLRVSPTVESETLLEVEYGEKLMTIGKPRGPWYKVYHPPTQSVGWLHGNTIRIE